MSGSPAPPAPPSPQPFKPPVMRGGARVHMLDIVRKYIQPLEFYFGLVLALGIVYVGEIPPPIQYFANTLIGRATLFALTIVVADMYSWIYAVLMALFTVLLIAVAPRTLREAFQGGPEAFQSGSVSPGPTAAVPSTGTDTEVKLVTQKHKWFVERVLGEHPVGIEEERVRTSSIQDGSNSSSSTTSR